MEVFSLRMCMVYIGVVWAKRHSVWLLADKWRLYMLCGNDGRKADRQRQAKNRLLSMGVLPCWRCLRTKVQVHVIKRIGAKVNKLEEGSGSNGQGRDWSIEHEPTPGLIEVPVR